MVTTIPIVSVDLHRLAVGCLYLLTGKADLEFPSTTRAHPSYFVVVHRTPQSMFQDGDQVYFPFKVPTRIWHKAVVPVLEDKDVHVYVRDNPSLKVPLNLALLTLGQYEDLIRKIEQHLTLSFVEAGYLPPEKSPTYGQQTPEGSTGGTPAGETIVYPETDPEVQHPDGTLKLSYRVVN